MLPDQACASSAGPEVVANLLRETILTLGLATLSAANWSLRLSRRSLGREALALMSNGPKDLAQIFPKFTSEVNSLKFFFLKLIVEHAQKITAKRICLALCRVQRLNEIAILRLI